MQRSLCFDKPAHWPLVATNAWHSSCPIQFLLESERKSPLCDDARLFEGELTGAQCVLWEVRVLRVDIYRISCHVHHF